MLTTKPLCDIRTGLLRATTSTPLRFVDSSSNWKSSLFRPATGMVLLAQPRYSQTRLSFALASIS